ncbi:MAG: exodeoxyribonuclease VII large subunit [Candidatus Marinimicrobia bacterium]|nr:exodeoxyribonuclease VII large subunit [Candidatus Neomarinimicrobiota bacterium]|tara:strand:- start:1986 stop:3317 length:1332 start_codon:yes stop_codon:yes gene_type:complete
MSFKINIPEFAVSEFNKAFKDVIETNFNYVRIKGEISEIKTATKGQIYLTLKDQDSILSGVIWEQKKKYLDIIPELGLEIIATGKITTWSRFKTTYQIDIDKIEIAGEGALLKLIEERKKKLQKKGYFDQDKKTLLPYLPNRIGIITSPTGSVVYDIINRVNDRFPIPLDIWPVSVQGTDAVSDISNAIIGFNQMKLDKPDIIIIARGGGSTEDLMAFNDEKLAVKVFESKIPIVSAIGHETDTTIIDLVSDLRASTPTAAAEKTVPVRSEIEAQINNLKSKLNNNVNSSFNTNKDNLKNLNKLLKAPSFIINFYNEKLNQSFQKLYLSIKNKLNIIYLNLSNIGNQIEFPDNNIKIKKLLIKDLSKNLDSNLIEKYENINLILKSNARLLNSNSISTNLKKGYSILMDKNKIIKTIRNTKLNSNLKVKLNDGKIEVKVKKIN